MGGKDLDTLTDAIHNPTYSSRISNAVHLSAGSAHFISVLVVLIPLSVCQERCFLIMGRDPLALGDKSLSHKVMRPSWQGRNCNVFGVLA